MRMAERKRMGRLRPHREEAIRSRLSAFGQYANVNRVLCVRFGNNPVLAQVTISDGVQCRFPLPVAGTKDFGANLERIQSSPSEIRIMEIQKEQYRARSGGEF